MVICFEEKHRDMIESKGMTIIEFKRSIYKAAEKLSDAWRILKVRINEAVNAVTLAVDKAVGNIKLVIESVKDVISLSYDCHDIIKVSFRYKTVKFLSKCTGIKMWKLWRMTRHTWLARSCC